MQKSRPLLHKLASLHHSVSFLRYTCIWGVAISSRGVVRTSRFRSAKIKTAKVSSEEYGRIFAKIYTSENFPLYGILSRPLEKSSHCHTHNCICHTPYSVLQHSS